MKILAIDTTTKYLCLGAYDGRTIYEYNVALGQQLSARLVPTLSRIFKALDWKADDIDYFACGLGPGSFTGVRIGLSAVKAMAWSLKKALVGVSTLDILALNGLSAQARVIVPVIDAKRGLVYASIYRRNKDSVTRVSAYMLLEIEELAAKLSKTGLPLNQAVIFGDAAALYKEKILRLAPKLTFLEKDYWNLAPHNIVKAALEKIDKRRFEDAFTVKPIYLYPKECQIRGYNVKRSESRK